MLLCEQEISRFIEPIEECVAHWFRENESNFIPYGHLYIRKTPNYYFNINADNMNLILYDIL